jgi:Flp pilus assembly protein TadD
MTGDPAAAAEAARQSLVEAGPEAVLQGARARIALGAALAAQGDADGSADAFAGAVELLKRMQANREAARAWTELGNVLAEAGDTDGAVRAFQQATAELRLGPPPGAKARPLPHQASQA